ncbi:aminotransferase class IV [Leptolyngbya sp. FACHB-17]|uniref:aminotransferase class IV n=1 Tax=unclassified Leptolyngbya TaxID=2650499 RepID=UPI001681797F|nr:aminotransferase class IV [Leptolyngbya sp. FACHB-17]MBD2083202.1 aminotransferase class IV [Leptolyngbya sp. FACHB-17]
MVKHWYNGSAIEGDQIQLSINDPGLIYGATTFTTLRVYQSLDHALTQWDEHCDRLKTTIAAFHWQDPNWNNIRSGAEWMALHYPTLRVVVFPDGREWITGRSLPLDLAQRQQQGITAWVAESELSRSLPQHKTGNYLAPWLALQTAQQLNAQEAILIDQHGNWLESSTGTLWGWKDDRWWTPPLSTGILPGLLRSRLVPELSPIEEAWTAEVVKGFEAIAYTNCVMELIPIHTVLDRDQKYHYNSAHTKFQQIRNLFLSNSTDL